MRATWRDEGAPHKVLARGGWDVAVLQENGRVAARSPADAFTFAARLVRAVREAGVKPVFYMTWAYRDRPADHATIRETYDRLGARLGVQVAPVGEAWRLARQDAPGIELFAADGIHPAPAGTYPRGHLPRGLRDLRDPHRAEPGGSSARPARRHGCDRHR